MNHIYRNTIYKAKFVKLIERTFQTRQYLLEHGKTYELKIQFRYLDEKKELICSNIDSINFTHEVNIFQFFLFFIGLTYFILVLLGNQGLCRNTCTFKLQN